MDLPEVINLVEEDDLNKYEYDFDEYEYDNKHLTNNTTPVNPINTVKKRRLKSLSNSPLTNITDLIQYPPLSSNNNNSNQLKLSEININNLEELQQLNKLLFPVHYHDSFYTDLLNIHPKGLSSIAYIDNNIIGAICCRKEYSHFINILDFESGYRTYIMTIGIIEEYRRCKIGILFIYY